MSDPENTSEPDEPRVVEVLRGDSWTRVSMGDLLLGECFRLYEADGKPVDDGAISIVTAPPVPREGAPGRWRVTCEPYKLDDGDESPRLPRFFRRAVPDLDRIYFEAYRESADGLTVTGAPIPTWDEVLAQQAEGKTRVRDHVRAGLSAVFRTIGYW